MKFGAKQYMLSIARYFICASYLVQEPRILALVYCKRIRYKRDILKQFVWRTQKVQCRRRVSGCFSDLNSKRIKTPILTFDALEPDRNSEWRERVRPSVQLEFEVVDDVKHFHVEFKTA